MGMSGYMWWCVFQILFQAMYMQTKFYLQQEM